MIMSAAVPLFSAWARKVSTTSWVSGVSIRGMPPNASGMATAPSRNKRNQTPPITARVATTTTAIVPSPLDLASAGKGEVEGLVHPPGAFGRPGRAPPPIAPTGGAGGGGDGREHCQQK